MHRALIVALAIGLAGCSNNEIRPRVQEAGQAVYFTSWTGKLFRIDGDKLTPIEREGEGVNAPRTVPFTLTIPATDSEVGFPVAVSGAVKFDGDAQKVRLSLSLAADGKRQPSAADQAKFADGLSRGSERIKGITLTYLDGEGFVASSPRTISTTTDEDWTRVVDDHGVSTGYTWNSRSAVNAKISRDVKTVDVRWSAIRPTTQPVPVAEAYPVGEIIPDAPAADAAAPQ